MKHTETANQSGASRAQNGDTVDINNQQPRPAKRGCCGGSTDEKS